MPHEKKRGAWRDFFAFLRSPGRQRRLVIYSEGPEYWLHYKGIIDELLSRPGFELSYVSSSRSDPGLVHDPKRMHPFYVGFGLARMLWFMTLRAEVLATTMPDIERFHIKRSRLHPVRYVYLFHAPVSTHMMYREGAFDHYDEIFCVGPHHHSEIRAREKQLSLPEKVLFHHGYSRLDDLIARSGLFSGDTPNDPPWVLVAPSWTDNGILATVGTELVRILLDSGLRVTVRPHPRTRLVHPEQLEALRREFGERELFDLEDGTGESAALAGADVMVSDWSGVALEYAFIHGKPILFIDTPRKMENKNYEALGIEPMEAMVRLDIGEVLAMDRLADAPAAIRRLCADPGAGAERRLAARDKWIYNVGCSDKAAADHLVELTEAAKEKP